MSETTRNNFNTTIGETPIDNTGRTKETAGINSGAAPKRKRLQFFQKGIQKYKLTLEAEMQLSSMNAKTKTDTHFQLQVKDFSEDAAHINYLSYDKYMSECNNTGFKEMFAITRQFERLYDEQDVTVRYDSGTIVGIGNIARLQEKCLQIKKEAVPYFNETTDIEGFFGLTDQTMYDENFWEKMLNEQEWLYLLIVLPGYGKKLNTDKKLQRDNAFRSNIIDWDLQCRTNNSATAIYTEIKGKFSPTYKWWMKAYGKMPFFVNSLINPDFRIEAQYIISPYSRFIQSAEIYIQELMSQELLFHKLKYTITQEE